MDSFPREHHKESSELNSESKTVSGKVLEYFKIQALTELNCTSWSELICEPSSEWKNDENGCQNNKLACNGSKYDNGKGVARQTRSCSIEPENLDSGVMVHHLWIKLV